MFLDEFERMSSNQPVVSGVRPNFGPYETPIDIRGNNLGFTRDDVKSVKICGVECIAQAKWISQTHIKCMNLVVTAEEVTGDIIVTTQSGGEGTSDGPQFTAHPPKDGSGLQSKYWEGDDKFVIRFGRTKETVVDTPVVQKERDLLCLYDDLNMTERSSISQLQKMLPHATESSGDVKSEDFDPVFYILQNHASTKLEQLKQGQTLLNGLIDKQQKGPVEHLKKNMSQIVECNDIIQSLSRPIKDDQYLTSDKMAKLCENVKKVNLETQNLFSDVLQRKDESDSMRNALNVLSRYNFLFSLPKTILANVDLDRYDLIIKDFEHATVLLERNDDHPVFETLKHQINEQISKVKDRINEQLMDMPNSLDFQVRMVDFLVKLGLSSKEDPAWQAILKMGELVGTLLNKCREAYSDFENNRLTVEITVNDPIKIVFVKEISELFKVNMKLLLEMGEAYRLSGRTKTSKSNAKYPRYYAVGSEPEALMRNLPENLQTFVSMCTNMTRLFINHVNKALDSTFELGDPWVDEGGEGSNEHMMTFVGEMRGVVGFFGQSGTPGEVLEVLAAQLIRMRKYCFVKVLQNATAQMEEFEEAWQFKITDSGFESVSLAKIVESMQQYLAFIDQINTAVDENLESSLWQSISSEERAQFTQLLCQFFALIAEKYYAIVMTEDFMSEAFITRVNAKSNITTVSCFSALKIEMILIVIMRNVAVLSAFAQGEFAKENYPNLPVKEISDICVTRYSEIFMSTRVMFAQSAYQLFQTIAVENNLLDVAKSNDFEDIVDHVKITKLCRLFLHHLVRVFGYLKTIHPSSVKSLFGLVIGQLVKIIQTNGPELAITYADIELVRRLLASYMELSDDKILEHSLMELSLSEAEKQKCDVEINSFLDRNRFHFISFSG